MAPDQRLTVGGQSPLHSAGQTLRQIAHVSIGGADRAVISAGAVIFSDPVSLTVPDFADLAIDLYLPEDTSAMRSPVTTHPASWQTNYVTPPGNFSGAPAIPVLTTTAYRRADGLASATSFFLSRVEVLAPAGTGAVVAVGDSMTDGTASGIDANNRWPDHLARRLLAANIRMGVLNAGIGGKRVLNDGNGPSALARFDRDVLAQTGVTHVVVLEGINDIGQGTNERIAERRRSGCRARAEFDPGDHLHLTPAGYEAAARAIDLSLFRDSAPDPSVGGR